MSKKGISAFRKVGHPGPVTVCCCSLYIIHSSTRQDKTAILGEISPIFRSYSAYFPPMVPHPYYKLKHMLPICRFSAHMFTDFAYFPLIFRLKFCLFSARPVLPGSPVGQKTSFALWMVSLKWHILNCHKSRNVFFKFLDTFFV